MTTIKIMDGKLLRLDEAGNEWAPGQYDHYSVRLAFTHMQYTVPSEAATEEEYEAFLERNCKWVHVPQAIEGKLDRDLLGNYNVQRDDDGNFIMTQEDFDWWNKVAETMRENEELFAIAKMNEIDVTDIYESVFYMSDLEDIVNTTNSALKELLA